MDLGDRVNELLNAGLGSVPAGFGDYRAVLRAHRTAHSREHWIGEEHPQYAHLLEQLVLALQPGRVLEIGVQCGGSAYGLTRSLAASALFVGIDNECCPSAQAGGADFYQLYGGPNQLFVTGEPARVLPLFAGTWDLVHLDHFKECYLPDLALLGALGQLRSDTLVVMHDSKTWAKGFVEQAAAWFAHQREAEVCEGARLLWGYQP